MIDITTVKGFVIPHVSYVGEIEDMAEGDDSHFDYGAYKRYRLLIYCAQKVHALDENNKEAIEKIREEIIEKINSYYSHQAYTMRLRTEKEF